MLKLIVGACLLPALVSCVAPPSWPSQTSFSVADPQTPASARFAPGRWQVANYAGQGDGGRISVRLTSLADGRTRAEGSVAGSGETLCMGTFSGTGSFQGRTMKVREESLPGCVVTLTRNGRSLSVDAGGQSCVGLSGPSCSLSGTLMQR